MSDSSRDAYPPSLSVQELLDRDGINLEGGKLHTHMLLDREEVLLLAILQSLLNIEAKLDGLNPHKATKSGSVWADRVADDIMAV